MNNALVDYNLSDKEFRLLYLIVNNMSMNNTNEIEMYNGFIMDKLNLSERQTQRLTASLVEKGYITKLNSSTKSNRNGNLIRLNGVSMGDMMCDKNVTPNSDIMCDTDCDKNVTPYNTRKINKNISVYTGTSTRGDKTDTDDETMIISVQVEDNINVSGSNADDSACGDTDDISNEVKETGTNPQVKLSKEELKQRNNYISAVYGKLEEKFNYLYSLKSVELYPCVVAEIAEIFKDAQNHDDYFTDGQWQKLCRYNERFVKLTEIKDNYFFNGTGVKTNADAYTISMYEENNSGEFNDSSNDNGGVAPQKCKDFTREEAITWAAKTVTMYDNFCSWDRAITDKFNTKYGDGWDWGKDPNACRLWNITSQYASKYYAALDDSMMNTPTPTDENDVDLAPWEMPLNTVYEPSVTYNTNINYDNDDMSFDEFIKTECAGVA